MFEILVHAVSAFYVSSTLNKMAKTAEFHSADTLFMSFLSIAQKLTTRPQDNNRETS